MQSTPVMMKQMSYEDESLSGQILSAVKAGDHDEVLTAAAKILVLMLSLLKCLTPRATYCLLLLLCSVV